MSLNWVCIYSSKKNIDIEIVQEVLSDNNINSVVMNKQDSSYFFGDIELYVHPDDAIQAKNIINNENL